MLFQHTKVWFEHAQHVALATHLKSHLLTFLFKVLHIRHPCYLFTLFHFASSARTRNFIVTPHRSLAMGFSFMVGHVSMFSSTSDKKWACFGALCGIGEDALYVIVTFRRIGFFFFFFFFFWGSLSFPSLLHIFTVFCSYFWRCLAGSALILVWCRPSTYRQIVTDLM
jgi:hypothetical protein